MGDSHSHVRCLPCWGKTGEGFKQALEWITFEDEVPPVTDTVLLATDYSLALGYVSLEGYLVVEHMPWGQEECVDDEPEFVYWMPLPETPIWLRYRNEWEMKKAVAIQLRLWE